MEEHCSECIAPSGGALLQVVGKVSSWIAADARDAALRGDSQAALAAELNWAAHLSLQAKRVLQTLSHVL